MSVPTLQDVLEAPGSAVVAGARLALLADAVDAPQVLGRCTDEELVGLDDPGAAGLAPSPWWSSLSADEQQTALTAALRGLSARGVYEATPVDESTGEFTFRAAPEILALVTMRRWTGTVVVGERRVADRTDWVVLYQQRAAMWLAEYVTHVGQHEFVLSTDDDAAALLTTWCGADPDAPRPELDLVLTREQVAAQDPSLEPVGRSTAAVTVTRLDVRGGSGETTGEAPDDGSDEVDETWSGVFTGPEGSYLSVAVDDDRVSYRGAGRADVLAHWRTTLGAV
ncbi:hypothetical protein [Cellulomonas sp. HZM]|uniref:hypothetical protein n=1 Tax=Cellulomonas sp. HZM TaxID=1454010 RepID=UPI0004930CED|nr:hypothetical protein [Cellulomonas sp. HZM]